MLFMAQTPAIVWRSSASATACQKPHLPMATTNSYNTLLQIELSEVLWEMVLAVAVSQAQTMV